MFAFATSLTCTKELQCPFCFEMFSAFVAHFCFLCAVHLSVEFIPSLCLCRQLTKTISCNVEQDLLGGWLFPATWNSDPRKSRGKEVLVLLDFNVLQDALIPFAGIKYRWRRISLGSHVLCSHCSGFLFPPPCVADILSGSRVACPPAW